MVVSQPGCQRLRPDRVRIPRTSIAAAISRRATAPARWAAAMTPPRHAIRDTRGYRA